MTVALAFGLTVVFSANHALNQTSKCLYQVDPQALSQATANSHIRFCLRRLGDGLACEAFSFSEGEEATTYNSLDADTL